MSAYSTIQIAFLLAVLAVGIGVVAFRWKQGKSYRGVIAFFAVIWLVSIASIILYNGYYKIALNENELPINDRWAEAIALKSENGGWLDYANGPFAHLRTIDRGSYFAVILVYEGDGCTKRIIDVEKQTGEIMNKKTDTAECRSK
jgi:hypothetical protein